MTTPMKKIDLIKKYVAEKKRLGEAAAASAAVAVAKPSTANTVAPRSLDELNAIVEGFTVADLDLSFDAFKIAVRDRRRPANAFDLDRLAFEIRGALRELKKTEKLQFYPLQ